MSDIISIYIITNILNGKEYIGITNNIKKRWSTHRSATQIKTAIHHAIKKHGKENFLFHHYADAFNWSHACEIEKMLIAEKNTLSPNGYNLTKGGDGSLGFSSHNKGKKWSEESKEKMRQAKLGKKDSEETRIKKANILKNMVRTKEHNKKIAESQKGVLCPQRGRIGKKHSEETKRKISESRLKRYSIKRCDK